MHLFLSTLLPIAGLAHAASYTLEDDFGAGSSFFDKFDFFTQPDPTHGYVKYVDRPTAKSAGLVAFTNSSTYMGVDHTNIANSGRSSVRITSKKSYNHGLFILDLAHMPASICGTWPAYWLLGPNWPTTGEIDIIEGVNSQSTNKIAGHTSAGCTISSTGFTGTAETTNCDVAAVGQAANQGCSINLSSGNSYGTGFNEAKGGVYATEWTSGAISVWFFARGNVPGDLQSKQPNPGSWGTPRAKFAGAGCDIDAHFKGMQIVFDTTFCGDWAGATWASSGCASKASSCEDYVANHPDAFKGRFKFEFESEFECCCGGVSAAVGGEDASSS
ncbi:hypothetical protein FE257_011065 [Aspergillus nanangensis]|uniref:endo-1,3(4)-beta-glucanase n=1 Tax=Aspergillus nanangensis TaxID=2582783 RepID=A0AAD4CJA9_ASPNN|nr:hypothetical protein FE257_011065 [Aspergillus nanangensis]